MYQRTLSTVAAVAVLLTVGAGAMPRAEAQSAGSIGFGVDPGGLQPLAAAGLKPDYVQLWVGTWTLTGGWTYLDREFDRAYAEGVTPVIQFYYWGGDLNWDCYSDGCWSGGQWKDQAKWGTLAWQLQDHLKSHMRGRAAIIVLETEFNKGAMATSETLDAGLESKARFFKSHYPAAKVVLGFGNWARDKWGTFDRAAAASDYLGLQGMRASTRDSEAYYLGVVGELVEGARELQRRWWKPVFVSDLAFSSHWEPHWLSHQARVIKGIMDQRGELKKAGVIALVYRSLYDVPTATTAEYYGEGERHFGLSWHYNRTAKPALDAWKNGMWAERSGGAAPVTTTSASSRILEAEAFTERPVGGVQYDSAASGGKRWNVWSNGAISQYVSLASGTYAIAVRAHGSVLDGVAPRMEVRLDDRVLSATYVTGSPAEYVVSVPVSSGGHMLRIAFVNDARNERGDRNLLVDRVDIGPGSSAAATGLVVGGTPATLELESAAKKTTGAVGTDGGASAGKFWNLWSNGYVQQPLDVRESGTYEVRVRAKGTLLDGRAPHMDVHAGDGRFLATDPGPWGFTDYVGQVWLASGQRDLRIYFTNDAFGDGEDRNLFLDRLEVRKVG